MANESKTRRFLRPEARPLPWRRLNASQQDVFRKILQAMDEARCDLDRADRSTGSDRASTPPPNLLQQTDRFRSSRLIFLSGQRGTGKSTVLISLFDAFLNSYETPSAAGEEIEPLVQGLRHRIVWLDPLDMEPLPHPTNLLAAILARIDMAVTRFVVSAGDSPRPTGLLNLASGEKALLDLRKLAADVAIAWDGNVQDRAGALDPDSYAEEVIRVEEARLGINGRLDKTLDALARELDRTREVKNPLFVLPVDDYDLNPVRALDLLHLIRMISSPRLFILVLGDVRMAEVMFNLKKSGEFASILRDANSSDYLSLSPSEIASVARTLSGHAIRKLIPPGQRLSLGSMNVEEALEFQPDRLYGERVENPGGLATLGGLLQELSVEVETAALTTEHEQCIGGMAICDLEDFLLFDLLSPRNKKVWKKQGDSDSAGRKQDEQPVEPRRTKAYPYTGAALLKAAPRYIADLWFALDELVERKGTSERPLNDLIERIGQEAHRAVEEDPLLPIRCRESFVDALGIGADEGWLEAMKFVQARSVSVPGRLVPFREEGCVLNAQYKRSWAFWDLVEKKPIEIDERAKALLILLHDLLALEREGGIVGSHALSPDSLNLDWAFASWDAGLPEEVKVPWITPAWTSFWEFEQFEHLWNHALRGNVWSNAEDAQRAYLAYAWIAGITMVLCGQPAAIKTLGNVKAEDLKPEAVLWTDLENAIRSLVAEMAPAKRKPERTRPSPARADLIESWLIRLVVLLSPESGFLPGKHEVLDTRARELFADSKVEKFFDQTRIWSKVQRLRADRLAPFIDTDLLARFQAEEQTVNTINQKRFNPDKKLLDEARLRAIKRGAIGPQERIAAALEGIAERLAQGNVRRLTDNDKSA
jgi:hypothetical protein